MNTAKLVEHNCSVCPRVLQLYNDVVLRIGSEGGIKTSPLNALRCDNCMAHFKTPFSLVCLSNGH